MSTLNGNFDSLPFSLNGYCFEDLLGKGSYGNVFKVTQEKTGHIFAAKAMVCDPSMPYLAESIKTESYCLMNLLHPNIIKIYDCFKNKNVLYLILEYCGQGSLQDLIERGADLGETQMLQIMKQLLTAIQYCHSKSIAHRDIKPANIMISENNVFKLGDFGLGIHMKDEETLNDSSGSFMFKAPELLQKKEHNPFKADIWSLGVTFYVMATGGRNPWGFKKETIEKNIICGRYRFPQGIPNSIKEIIKSMLVVDPDYRATSEELLSSLYFSKIKWHSQQPQIKDTIKNVPNCLRTKVLFPLSKRKISMLSKSSSRVYLPKKDTTKSPNFYKNICGESKCSIIPKLPKLVA